MADSNQNEDVVPSRSREEHDMISSDDDVKDDHETNVTRNMAFSSQKEAQEYERKKANAILANPLRGLSHGQLRRMGKEYALGKQSPNS